MSAWWLASAGAAEATAATVVGSKGAEKDTKGDVVV